MIAAFAIGPDPIDYPAGQSVDGSQRADPAAENPAEEESQPEHHQGQQQPDNHRMSSQKGGDEEEGIEKKEGFEPRAGLWARVRTGPEDQAEEGDQEKELHSSSQIGGPQDRKPAVHETVISRGFSER